MPKVSKVKPPTSRPGEPKPRKTPMDKFMCARCGQIYKRQKNNFLVSHSPIYIGNNGYLTVCKHCMDDLFEHYREVLGGNSEAMERVCQKFDIYWNPELFSDTIIANHNKSKVTSYITKTNLIRYINKTYDDTIDEQEEAAVEARQEAERRLLEKMPERVPVEIAETEAEADDGDADDGEKQVISREVVNFWGVGFTASQYVELERKFTRWTADVTQPIDTATEALYKQVCIIEMTINEKASAGKPIEQSVNALNTILGSLNAKPIQKKQTEASDAPFDGLPFGVGIKMCENTKPISKINPRYDDVDRIKAITHTYVYGHLAKLVGIKNGYCKLYEEEMERMRVKKPEFADEEDDDFLADIFRDTIASDDIRDADDDDEYDGGDA